MVVNIVRRYRIRYVTHAGFLICISYAMEYCKQYDPLYVC